MNIANRIKKIIMEQLRVEMKLKMFYQMHPLQRIWALIHWCGRVHYGF